MYFNTGSMAQLFVFYFGENRWRHPTDGRDMNRERNSSKSWGDGNLDSMSVYGHQLHRFIFSHQKPLKVFLWAFSQLLSLFCLKIFCSIYQKPNNKKLICHYSCAEKSWIKTLDLWFYRRSVRTSASPASSDLCEPILRKLIPIKLLS